MHGHVRVWTDSAGSTRLGKGAGERTKVLAVTWACKAMDEGARVHETCPRTQVRHRQGCTAVDGWPGPHTVWMRALVGKMRMQAWNTMCGCVWARTAVDKGMMAHETSPRAQARHRRKCAAMDGQHRPHMAWTRVRAWLR